MHMGMAMCTDVKKKFQKDKHKIGNSGYLKSEYTYQDGGKKKKAQ